MNERMCSSCVGRVKPGALGIENTSILIQHSPQTLDMKNKAKQSPAASAPQRFPVPPAGGGASGQCVLGSRGCPGAEVGAHLLLVLSEPPARRLGGPGTLSSLVWWLLLILMAPTFACTQSRYARM